MIYPNKKEFLEFAKKGNLIPVYKEIISDAETPVTAFAKIKSNYSFLLESIEGGEKIGRYSFLGADPILTFKSKGRNVEIIREGKIEKKQGDPFAILKNLYQQFKAVKIPALPRFHGGFVGYFGYDTVRFIEKIPDKNPDPLNLYDIQLMLTESFLAFDHLKHKIIVIANAFIGKDPEKAYEKALNKINSIEKKVSCNLKLSEFSLPVRQAGLPKNKEVVKTKSNYSPAEFKKMVEKAKVYIKKGDIIQVVPSQRFTAEIKTDPFNVYRLLRIINPSPYLFFLNFKDTQLVGSSPEVMVRLEEKTATLRPIAGTRPRGKTQLEDQSLEKELLADKKEIAEHIMLVDLARNDLGRVCENKSIKVEDFMTIERYSHVMHIVSNVSGKLKNNLDCFDLFKASFPAGTVSGAPKIRAMEIIDEIEKVRRTFYAGAVGYMDFAGNMDTGIAIRTILIQDKKAYLQVGAGIVADSIPQKEYQETLNKAQGLLQAIFWANKIKC